MPNPRDNRDWRVELVDGLLPYDATYEAKAATYSSSGNNTHHTPASGKQINLCYVCLSADGANVGDVTVIVKFGAGGASKYKISLKPGALWARNIGAGRRTVKGTVDETLVINLSAAETVHVSTELLEGTP